MWSEDSVEAEWGKDLTDTLFPRVNLAFFFFNVIVVFLSKFPFSLQEVVKVQVGSWSNLVWLFFFIDTHLQLLLFISMLKEKEQSVGLVAQLQPERSLERRLNCSKNWQIWALAASVQLVLKSPYKRSSEIGFPLKKKKLLHILKCWL